MPAHPMEIALPWILSDKDSKINSTAFKEYDALENLFKPSEVDFSDL